MKTVFYQYHESLGARLVDFHGWQMPVQYSGIIDEHNNVRSNVGLFDVSHMGRFKIKGPNAYDCLQNLVTNDISKLEDYHALYSPICLENGGIVDDVIVYRINSDDYLMVVNSSNRQKDYDWIIEHSMAAVVENISEQMALLAIQGPLAQQVLQETIDKDLSQLKPFHLTITRLLGVECIISRTGYTGEDGFEIFFDSSREELWNSILKLGSKFNIKPAGLGARDTLRLEAGLMLYGNDIDENTTPMETPLKWTVKFEKQFIGKKALKEQRVSRKLVGFEILGAKRVARKDNKVLLNGSKAGFVTSGSFSPTLNKSIGFCFIPLEVSPDKLIEIDIGGKLYKAKITSTKFYKRK
ncbi:MAG: glycine cleavage system aminomethyltransferase GcvT [Nitrosopumilaceae archaeon]